MEDLVLSDVHVFDVDDDEANNTSSAFVDKDYKIIQTRFEVAAWSNVDQASCAAVQLDDDGDYDIPGRCSDKEIILINHATSTTLADVGLQVWNGALLMSEFILAHKSRFAGKSVFELGCGVGLVSVCLEKVGANPVFATDFDEKVLQLCQRNVDANCASDAHAVITKHFDWKLGFDHSWTNDQVERAKRSEIIVAADVVYDVKLNEHLFNRIIEFSECSEKTVFFALEKRYNFTLSHLDVACPAYESFVDFLESLKKANWHLKQLDVDAVPELFGNERNLHMKLWELSNNSCRTHNVTYRKL